MPAWSSPPGSPWRPRPAALPHDVPDADRVTAAVFAERGWSRRGASGARTASSTRPPGAGPAGRRRRRPRPRPPGRRPAGPRPRHLSVRGDRRAVRAHLAQWSAFLLDHKRFDPSLTLVAAQDGQVVGAALGQATGDCGFIRQLAVAPGERGRGLGLALMHECFTRHRARGLLATVLGVDAANPTGALALYERAGMRVAEQFTRWEWMPST